MKKERNEKKDGNRSFIYTRIEKKNYRITETLRFTERLVCIEIEENFKRKSCEKKHDN